MLVMVALALMAPRAAYASDTTGAIPFVVGMFGALLLVAGFVVALILYFGFKRKGAVLVFPLIPGALVGALTVWMILQPTTKYYHRGVSAASDSVGEVVVSRKFGEPELAKLYSQIESAQFRTELAQYSTGSISNLAVAVDLVVPASRSEKSGVYIYATSAVAKDKAAAQAVQYLVSKAVAATDPSPVGVTIAAPSKIR